MRSEHLRYISLLLGLEPFEHEAERPDDEVDEGEAEREHETEDEHVKQLVQI